MVERKQNTILKILLFIIIGVALADAMYQAVQAYREGYAIGYNEYYEGE